MEHTWAQKAKIRTWLEAGNSLTTFESRYLFSCDRLASRIGELRKEGMNIDSPLVEVISGGRKKRVAQYKLLKS